jgi:predicted GTPase
MKTKRILILGAAGRDFHNFNVVFRGESEYNVVGFTATQIPGIANRRYPAELAGHLYPLGIPIFEEKDFEHLVDEHQVDAVVFSYSDISHQNLMHLASRVVATGADFWLLSSQRTQIKSSVPVVSICAVRTGCGKSPIGRFVASELRRQGQRWL